MVKVIIMIPSALTERWQGMFCIDALASKFDLEYWDCSKICEPAFEATTTLKRDYICTITNMEDMEDNLRRLTKDAVVISHIHLDGFNYEIHKLISKYIKTRVFVDFWANSIEAFVQNTTKKNTKIDKLIGYVKHLLWHSGAVYYLVRFLRAIRNRRLSDVRSAIDDRKNAKRFLRAKKLYNNIDITVLPHQQFSINHPDYEKYIDIISQEEKPIIEGDYIVFLDQYFPMHPTLKSENPDIDFDSLKEPYYNSLNLFFDKLEKEYGCPVVIAGHPIAKYDKNPFGNRSIVYFKTAELVHESKYVVLHNSYSISFVLLFNKPFCMITNNAHQFSSVSRKKNDLFGKTFKRDLVNVDLLQDVHHLFTLADYDVREKYIESFFDTNVKEKNAEILARHIEAIHYGIVESQL